MGHSLASVKATEAALGIPVSEQTFKLRSLAKHAENIDSHIVHVLFLVAPDVLGASSVFPLVPTHGEVIKQALQLKRLGHEFGSALCGRTTHPTRIVPGGFSELPTLAVAGLTPAAPLPRAAGVSVRARRSPGPRRVTGLPLTRWPAQG